MGLRRRLPRLPDEKRSEAEMAEFVVKVADERGRMLQSVEQGYSVAEVRDRYASQGYLVYYVKPQGMLSAGLSIGRRRKLKQASFLVFNQQFLTLLKAGLPILNSLDLLIKRQRDRNLGQILENVRERVKGGELLSDAFATHRMVPKIYTTTLMAGEKSGNIDEVLTRYINFQRLAMTFRKKLFVFRHHSQDRRLSDSQSPTTKIAVTPHLCPPAPPPPGAASRDDFLHPLSCDLFCLPSSLLGDRRLLYQSATPKKRLQ